MDVEKEIQILKLRTDELSDYNSKWPHDLNKYLKTMRNDIDDLRDYVDRLDHKKTKYKKLKTVDELYIKQLALENELINIKMSLHQLETKKPKNKKLKSDINNTKYSIKKLLIKQNEGTMTEKELERLKDKQKLLDLLLEQNI